MMTTINALLGAALLLFGRKVFWLFVAGAGFMVGMDFAARALNGPEWLSLATGIAVGIVAALLAVFVQQFAIGLAGFLGGGFLALQLLPFLNLDYTWASWAAFILGGVLGVILVSSFFDWALIILSSLVGASLLTGVLDFNKMAGLTIMIVLAALGIFFQARELRREKKK